MVKTITLEPLYRVAWLYTTPGGRGMRFSTQVRAPSEAEAIERVSKVMVADGFPMDRVLMGVASLLEGPSAAPATLVAPEPEADLA